MLDRIGVGHAVVVRSYKVNFTEMWVEVTYCKMREDFCQQWDQAANPPPQFGVDMGGMSPLFDCIEIHIAGLGHIAHNGAWDLLHPAVPRSSVVLVEHAPKVSILIQHIPTCQKSWADFNWWGPWCKISSVLPLIGYASFVQHVCSAQVCILCETCPIRKYLENKNRVEQSSNNQFHLDVPATARWVFELINPTSSWKLIWVFVHSTIRLTT